MASTYSNLKIELMATGANSTTWGTVTNVNIGAALGAAIAGSTNIAFSNANQTLTWTDDNGPQDARFVRLNLTGTATTGYDLIVPVIAGGKPYIINNGTDGTITVKNATGTGIPVPAGKTMWVYNNGTNVVDAVNHLSSLTLGTALAIEEGGTGANTAAGARTAIGAAESGANDDITSLSGLTTALSIAQGGTGANTAADARTALGLGSLATLSSINNSNWSGTDLAIENGGTGSSTAEDARTALGAQATLVSGTNIKTVNGTSLLGSGDVSTSLPTGIITLWSGSAASIPTGWLLCDGTNSTPDLRDRFVVGAGSTYAVGATGGSANATLVSHTHTATVTDPGHTHNLPGSTSSGGTIQTQLGVNATAQNGSTATATTGITVGISTEGSSATNANLPPYYALCYIMKS